MKWINFLHLYQPANQQKDVIEAVVKQSYRPMIEHIFKTDNVNLTINITGSLLELLERDGYLDLIEMLKDSVAKNKIELTGSAKYHAILPLITDEEIERQIKANEDTLKKYLGDDISLYGFFPPEMAVSPDIMPVIKKLGYKWIVMDEISYAGGQKYPKNNVVHVDNKTGLKIFYRNRRISNLIMSALARDTGTIKRSLSDEFKDGYLFTGMDGETFGHHRPGLENLLKEIINEFDLIYPEDVIKDEKFTEEKVKVSAATWASSEIDIKNNIQFLSWRDPQNEIHKKQWSFFDFVKKELRKVPNDIQGYDKIRKKMDIAMASDHFWWASAKPWWSLEMIEDGAYRFLNVIESIPDIDQYIMSQAYIKYFEIVSMAAEWQRSGKVREMARQQNEILRIPFKERTKEKGGSEALVYDAFIDMMREQERVSRDKGNYEQAIMWRDAVYKLENKSDIYDAISAIDSLRIEIGNKEVEETIDKYKSKYKEIKGGQPEQRGS